MSIDAIDSQEGLFEGAYFQENSIMPVDVLSLNLIPEIEMSTLEKVQLNSEVIERRAIIDVGSGGTKFLIADFNRATGDYTIVKEGKMNVPYQKALNASKDHTFDPEIRAQGIAAFQEIQEVFYQYGVQQSYAFATEAFRQAGNATDFVAEIANRSGINVHILEQKDEAAIAFQQAALHLGIPQEQLVVLEIGTGSFQLSIKDETAHMGDLGSVPFHEHIVQEILGVTADGKITSLTDEQMKTADKLARDIARQAEKDIKNVIRGDAGRAIVGIGNLFTRSLAPHATTPDVIVRKDIRNFIQEILQKTPEEIQSDPFLSSDLSNAILALGFMKALQIHEIHVLDTSNTTTILRNEGNWS
ncbi:Ppx/GppA phosphatase family protein [Simkania negevensis]|uniref:Putative exopolyphosphatase n=1 Tax=Simkania negevensis (strain ATCC VR-1471 / DSM 27360 / Z) TaxID=331113 RepID=F8L619_SIMNZ|nr:exopolyphosphatase [Simkania negevensis]CCB88172.1 putative exopolyphosphatase [Simkania negevensis Z]